MEELRVFTVLTYAAASVYFYKRLPPEKCDGLNFLNPSGPRGLRFHIFGKYRFLVPPLANRPPGRDWHDWAIAAK
jgi:hypothetical protein